MIYIKDFFVTKNCNIKRDSNTISMQYEDQKRKIPCEEIENIYLLGEISLNTKFLNFVASKGILVHSYNYYGYYSGSYVPRETNVSGKLLINQVLNHHDISKRIVVAKEIVKSASYNITKVLSYYKCRDIEVQDEIAHIKALIKKIDFVKNIPELMGFEGAIKKKYYECFQKIILDEDFKLEKRVKNPPDNKINSLISFINGLIYSTCLSEIYKTQLNPTISFLHEASTKRFSLCLDIADIFKPIIGDRLIFKLVNKCIIQKDDFIEQSNGILLKEKALKEIITQYEKRLEKTIYHRTLKKNVSYRHLIRLECYKMIKHFMNEKDYEGFKIWW